MVDPTIVINIWLCEIIFSKIDVDFYYDWQQHNYKCFRYLISKAKIQTLFIGKYRLGSKYPKNTIFVKSNSI